MKPFHLLFALLFLAIAGYATGQSADSTVLKELDAQIWYPFIKYYSNLDAENFNKLHTADVLRGGPRGISLGEAYFKSNLENSERSKKAGIQRSIAFRFEHRVTSGTIAYEVGYYRVVLTADGTEYVYFGRFDVVSKKVDGVWKIAQDWDVDNINGKKLEEADFLGNESNPVIYK